MIGRSKVPALLVDLKGIGCDVHPQDLCVGEEVPDLHQDLLNRASVILLNRSIGDVDETESHQRHTRARSDVPLSGQDEIDFDMHHVVERRELRVPPDIVRNKRADGV